MQRKTQKIPEFEVPLPKEQRGRGVVLDGDSIFKIVSSLFFLFVLRSVVPLYNDDPYFCVSRLESGRGYTYF